jgi:hypothetical protein
LYVWFILFMVELKSFYKSCAILSSWIVWCLMLMRTSCWNSEELVFFLCFTAWKWCMHESLVSMNAFSIRTILMQKLSLFIPHVVCYFDSKVDLSLIGIVLQLKFLLVKICWSYIGMFNWFIRYVRVTKMLISLARLAQLVMIGLIFG